MEANIQEWFRAFYATSDDGSAHEKYTTFFTSDGRLIMGNKTALGRAEILELRKDMWSTISSRKHTYRYYSSPDYPSTYLLEGEVLYGHETSPERRMKWVAKADFEGEGLERRLRFYQVFLNAGSK